MKVMGIVFTISGEDTRSSSCDKRNNNVGETRGSRPKASQCLRFQHKRRDQQRRQKEGAASEIGGITGVCRVRKTK